MQIEDEVFCLKYEQNALAVSVLTGKAERWVKGFIHPGIEQEHVERYYLACEYTINKNVLDIACGCGYGSYLLASKGQATNVKGVDIESDAIRYGNIRFSHDRVQRFCSDALKFKPETQFDVIVSFETVEHIEEYNKYISNLSEWLHGNGYLIISTPIVLQTSTSVSNPFHVIEWSFYDFHKLVADQFDIEEIYLQHIRIKNSEYSTKEKIKRTIRKMLSSFRLVSPPVDYKVIKGKTFEKYTNQYDMRNCYQGFQTLVLKKR